MRTLGKPSWGSICFNSDKVEVSMIVLLPVLSDNMGFILILDAIIPKMATNSKPPKSLAQQVFE